MDREQAKQMTFGLIVVAIGVLLLAGQLDLDWPGFADPWRLWPAVFVVLAIGQILGTDADRYRSAAWFVFLATVFFMHNFHILRLSDSWPLFVIAGGVSLMLPKRPGCGADSRSVTPVGPTPGGQA